MKENVEDKSHDLRESVQKVWLAGLGALQAAEEEGSKAFHRLVERGENFEARRKEDLDKVRKSVETVVDEAKEKMENAKDRMGGNFDARVAQTLNRLGVPTRGEIQALTRRVEKLTDSIDKLRENLK